MYFIRSCIHRHTSFLGRCSLLFLGVVVGYVLTEHTTIFAFGSNSIPDEEKIQQFSLREYGEMPSAKKLIHEVRVLCLIITSPATHRSKAIHVKYTWGAHCNKLLFMSSAEDKKLESIALPVHEGRNNLWAKTKEAFKYVYINHLEDADWFYKADDDTYAVVENLRYMLHPYAADTPIYFGCKFKPFVKQGYMSGGAGYVLSREAVKRLVVDGLPNPQLCKPGNNGSEDVQMGKCLANVDVIAGDSRDEQKRGRFFPMNLQNLHNQSKFKKKFWYWKYLYYHSEKSLKGCSDTAVSFHYVAPNQMYILEYFIYHLRPYGILSPPEPLPEKLKVGEIPKAINTTKPAMPTADLEETTET